MWCMSGVAGTPGIDSPSAPKSTGCPSCQTPAITADSSSASNCERRMPASSAEIASSDKHRPSSDDVPAGHGSVPTAVPVDEVGVAVLAEGLGEFVAVHAVKSAASPNTPTIAFILMVVLYRASGSAVRAREDPSAGYTKRVRVGWKRLATWRARRGHES